MEKFGKIFIWSTDWEKGAEGLQARERCCMAISSKGHFSNLAREWRMEKENAENTPKIPEQQDLQEKEC